MKLATSFLHNVSIIIGVLKNEVLKLHSILSLISVIGIAILCTCSSYWQHLLVV